MQAMVKAKRQRKGNKASLSSLVGPRSRALI